LIEDVSYLRSYDLYIKFTNGDEGIVDMSDSFEIPATLRFAPISEFKKFQFNDHQIWWGSFDSPDSMLISSDSMHRMMIPISFESTSSGVINLSMAKIDPPLLGKRGEVLATTFVQSHEIGESPHVYVVLKDKSACKVFLEDGRVLTKDNIKQSIQRKISEFIVSIRSQAVAEWNKWYLNMKVDPLTGKFIDRK
jgi:hypothetical protein